MPGTLLRVAYFSHNRLKASDAELVPAINEILEHSQINNSRDAITGALVFNRGVFGQILEGPAQTVEATFDRIQHDRRHDNVTVLEMAPAERRLFAAWTMGFVGNEKVLEVKARAATGNRLARLPDLSGIEMLNILTQLAQENEITARAYA